MASSHDSYSDIEDSDLDHLTESFNKAADHVQKLVPNLDSTKLLEIYSYYKQATVGSCNIQRPRWYEMQAKAKWDAWYQLGEMSKEEAKENYIRIVSELDSNFNEKSECWVSVSTLLKTELELEESDKTVFDYTKDGELDKLLTLFEKDPQLIHSIDENGLNLLHWASDRGNFDILECLVKLNTDVNSKDNDGQTPLHYAASCDHFACVQLLIHSGAHVDTEDSDGIKPKDLASDVKIIELLNEHL